MLNLNGSPPVSVFDPGSGDNNQPANGAKSAEGLPVENYLVRQQYMQCSVL